MSVCLLMMGCFCGYIGRKGIKMKKIRLDTPSAKSAEYSKNLSCQLVIIRDSKGKAVAYVSTTRHSTLVTIADLSDCVIDDVTTTNAVCQS